MITLTNVEQLRKEFRSDNYIAFTMDIDWASDDCISEMLDFFKLHCIPVNVFCTHPSEILEGRKADPMVELGIHPNYCDGSSQGENLDEITDYCMRLVPDARSVRGHRWFSSNDMYDRLVERGIKYDSNECTMMDLVEPYIHRSGVLRFPVFFEDGGLLWLKEEPDFKINGEKFFGGNGLKVLDLHPIHFAINSPTLDYYRKVSDTHGNGSYTRITSEEAALLRYDGKGIRTYVLDLVQYIGQRNINIVSLGQIYDEYVKLEVD